MRTIIFSILILVTSTLVFGQTSEQRAQGYYYKAKELYQSQSFASAVPYIEKAKVALNGTNYQLQYLHIMCLVKMNDWVAARKELKIYYDVETKGVSFSAAVERLTENENRELAKAMVDIEENAAYVESPEFKLKQLRKEVADLIISLVYEYKNSINHNDESGSYRSSVCNLSCNYEFNFTYSINVETRVWDIKYADYKYRYESLDRSFKLTEINSICFISDHEFNESYLSPNYKNFPVIEIKFDDWKKGYYNSYYVYRNVGNRENERNEESDKKSVFIRVYQNNQSTIDKINSLLPQIK